MAALSRQSFTRGLGRFWLLWHFRLFQRRRHRALVLESVAGVPLLVLPEVFNPALFSSSELLAEEIRQHDLAGREVLDLGTGSGVAGVVAALSGARVTAVDIAPEAVRCARINVLLNHVEEAMEVRSGDLFEPVRGRRFDLVIFNPPYFAGTAREPWEHAWRSEGILDRFACELPGVLKPGGWAMLVLSGEAGGVGEALARYPIEATELAERRMLSERFYIAGWRPLAEAVTA